MPQTAHSLNADQRNACVSLAAARPITKTARNADDRPSDRKEEAEDAWQKMRDWFRQHGV